MTLLYSILRRQISSSYPLKVLSVDSFLDDFSCTREDEYTSEGYISGVEGPPFACKFHKNLLQGQMLAVGDEEGRIRLIDSRKTGTSAVLKEWTAHANSIFDIAWMNNEPKLVTASGDQSANLWDVQEGKSLAIFRGHTCSLKSVNVRDNTSSVFATGARDGNIMIWDTRCQPKEGHYIPVNIIRDAHVQKPKSSMQRQRKSRARRRLPVTVATYDSQQSVTAVQFQDDHTLISAGAMDGNIKIWDLRKNYSSYQHGPLPQHVFPYPGSRSRTHGYSSLSLDSTKTRLFANCTDGMIYQFDCASLSTYPLCSYSGHTNTSFFVKSALSPDDSFLMSGSSDFDVFIWKVDQPWIPPHLLTGHNGEVTGVAWCQTEPTKVVSCSDDGSARIWRANKHACPSNQEMVGWSKKSIPKPSSPSALGLTPCLEKTSEYTTWRKMDKKECSLSRTYTNPRLNAPRNLISIIKKNVSNSPPRSPSSPSPSSPGFVSINLEPSSPRVSTQQPKVESPMQFMKTWLAGSRKRARDNESGNSQEVESAPSKMNKLDQCNNQTDITCPKSAQRTFSGKSVHEIFNFIPQERGLQELENTETLNSMKSCSSDFDNQLSDRDPLVEIDNIVEKHNPRSSLYTTSEKSAKPDAGYRNNCQVILKNGQNKYKWKSSVTAYRSQNNSPVSSPQRVEGLKISSDQKDSPGKSRRSIFDYFKPVAIVNPIPADFDEDLDSPSKDAQR